MLELLVHPGCVSISVWGLAALGHSPCLVVVPLLLGEVISWGTCPADSCLVSGGVGGAPGTHLDLLRIGYYTGKTEFKVLTLPALELISLWDGLCTGHLLGSVVG